MANRCNVRSVLSDVDHRRNWFYTEVSEFASQLLYISPFTRKANILSRVTMQRATLPLLIVTNERLFRKWEGRRQEIQIEIMSDVGKMKREELITVSPSGRVAGTYWNHQAVKQARGRHLRPNTREHCLQASLLRNTVAPKSKHTLKPGGGQVQKKCLPRAARQYDVDAKLHLKCLNGRSWKIYWMQSQHRVALFL